MKRLTRKQDSTEEATGPLTLVAPPHEDIPTALRIMRAIEDVRYLPRLGDCPTKDAIQEKIMRSREPRVVEYEYEDEPEEDNFRKRSPEDTKRREHNAVRGTAHLFAPLLALMMTLARRDLSNSSPVLGPNSATTQLVISMRRFICALPDLAASSMTRSHHSRPS